MILEEKSRFLNPNEVHVVGDDIPKVKAYLSRIDELIKTDNDEWVHGKRDTYQLHFECEELPQLNDLFIRFSPKNPDKYTIHNAKS